MDYFLFVDLLEISSQEKRLLRSLVIDKRSGRLTIELYKLDSRELDIDPSKTSVELADEISKAFDELYDVAVAKGKPHETLSVSFKETLLH